MSDTTHRYDTRSATRTARAAELERLAALPFPFEKLPPEIRNEIYRLVFGFVDNSCPIVNIRESSVEIHNDDLRACLRSSMFLLNKSVRAEVCSYVYHKTEFRIVTARDFDIPSVIDRLRCFTPERRNAIRTISISIPHHQLNHSPWSALCTELASMHIQHLNLTISCVECAQNHSANQSCESISNLANTEAPWINDLVRIRNLSSLALHTSNCRHGSLCGFSPEDKDFNENTLWEDDPIDPECSEPLTTGWEGSSSMALVAQTTLHHDCTMECFPRDFIVKVRDAIGLQKVMRWVKSEERWVRVPMQAGWETIRRRPLEWWILQDGSWWKRTKTVKEPRFLIRLVARS
ncbi:MAG: hypothetical protein M1812_000708 [Candelaria pacifica]|nr:MAG: hypothetical protein M1812_000708 [Candelaria pacifica]